MTVEIAFGIQRSHSICLVVGFTREISPPAELFLGKNRLVFRRDESSRRLNTAVSAETPDYTLKVDRLVPPVGVDYLELYVPDKHRFSREFEDARGLAPYRPDYEDLRSTGFPVVMRRNPIPRKGVYVRRIQLKNVGLTNAKSIFSLLSRVLPDVDPLTYRLYRVDLTADCINGPNIDQFRDCASVPRTRSGKEYFNTDCEEINGTRRHEWGNVQTITFGNIRKHSLKIYDKAAKARRDKNIKYIPDRWVRIEKTYVGGAVPEQLKTLGSLLANGPHFDPFSDLTISQSANVTQATIIESLNLSEAQKMKALYVYAQIANYGRNTALGRLRASHKRQYKQMLTLLDSVEDSFAMPSPIVLTGIYQDSFRKQLL